MIYINQEYKDLFREFRTVEDFLRIDMELVRDFKNRKTGRFEINGKGFYIKKHFECGFGMIIDELFHLRKPHIGAGYEKAVIDKLHAIGIDTMKIAAFGRERKSLVTQRSFLVTEELTHVESLEDICSQWPTKKPMETFRRSLVSQIARIARILHENGVNHRDFYICHFLLDSTGGPDQYQRRPPKLFLIDLHRAQQRASVPFRWRVKDISGLYFSAWDIGLTRSDIFRFIRFYTGKPLRQTLQQDRRFWNAVQQRAIRTYRKEFDRDPVRIVWGKR